MELKDIISYVGVAINQASDAKRDLMRGSAWGNDGVHSKQQQIDLLTNELSDASYSLDQIKDTLYQLLEDLEKEVYRKELEALSPFNKDK
jgi:hypothetical protein